MVGVEGVCSGIEIGIEGLLGLERGVLGVSSLHWRRSHRHLSREPS